MRLTRTKEAWMFIVREFYLQKTSVPNSLEFWTRLVSFTSPLKAQSGS